jgi:hypothetical protein
MDYADWVTKRYPQITRITQIATIATLTTFPNVFTDTAWMGRSNRIFQPGPGRSETAAHTDHDARARETHEAFIEDSLRAHRIFMTVVPECYGYRSCH